MRQRYWISAFIISFVLGLNLVLPLLTNKNAIQLLQELQAKQEPIVATADEFGDATLVGTSSSTIQYKIMAGYFQMGATGGTADSITAMLEATGGDQHVKCALYDTNGALIKYGVTEERTDIYPAGPTAETFNFVGTKPTLIANAWYLICAWAELMADDCQIFYDASGGDGIYFMDAQYGEYPDWGDWQSFEATGFLAIYCTYTETPSASWKTISTWNGTIYNSSRWLQISSWNGTIYNETILQGTFGNTFEGSTTNAITDTDDYVAFKFYCPNSGTADNITVLIERLVTTNVPFRCYIYDSSLNFVGATEIGDTGAVGKRWRTLNFTGTKPTLYPGYYFLTFNSNSTYVSEHISYFYNSTGGLGQLLDNDNGYIIPTYPASLTNDTWNAAYLGSIYCSYTTGAPPASWKTISSWNGTLYNSSRWLQISSWNGTLWNQSQYKSISVWNGTLFNQSWFKPIANWNGTVFNQTLPKTWQSIAMWNGTLFNSSRWLITTTWNGTLYNTSWFKPISKWNGTIWNQTIPKEWNTISSWNGTLYNQTVLIIISNWNGTLWNKSNWLIASQWNGTLFNKSLWFSVKVWNGTIFNSSIWKTVSSWNGTLWNRTIAHIISTWNGTIFNQTVPRIIDQWNGTIYNTSIWLQVSIWNGTVFNKTVPRIISQWNGTVWNASIWKVISNWNGTVYNQTIAKNWNIVSQWNGSLWNGTVKNWKLISDWNGCLYNGTGTAGRKGGNPILIPHKINFMPYLIYVLLPIYIYLNRRRR